MIRFEGRCSWVALALALVGAMGFGGVLWAQSPDAKTEVITQAIEERAARDIRIGRTPASISDLETLFGEQARGAGLSLDKVLAIYEGAYERAKPQKTFWQHVEPKVGWLTAGILLVLLVVRDQLTQALKWFFRRVTEAVYRRIAGLRPFWVLSLRRYRRSLARAYDQLKVPFRPGQPLRMQEIYVPLKVSGSLDRTHVSIHTALSRQGARLVILGVPGSGKSMLMKHLTLTYAVQGLGAGRSQRSPHSAIPVLLELHRLNESKPSETLEDHLAAALDRQSFPGGSSFLRAGLEKGMILLLLDGLDEVNQDARGRVVRQIKDLAKRSPACQLVVTCRTAVYGGEFSGWSDELMEIVEFDDRQIEGFLAAWESEMPEGKSVEHLLDRLYERPRIMALARNPLLLTIIAYLYSDTSLVLPHSRAEFYKKATDVLLEHWDRARQLRNLYRAPHKRLVLQALALAFQQRGSEEGQDRRSMPLASVLKEISAVLETLNLTAQDAEPLLEEIVERSGLLLALDGETRYQFTHLTLQEFLAALALSGDDEVLIEEFRAGPGIWREVAKLWCGLEHDSTQLLRVMAEIDPVAALECLGDTQQVEKEFSDQLISGFLGTLDQITVDGEAKALALVAADPRRRGEQTYLRLEALSTGASASETTRYAAARILSLTSLPKAADHLADLADSVPVLRPLLVNMGNLAVPFLSERAAQSTEWAVDLLFQIGTPRAAEALVPLLWAENPNQWKVALYLGSLIANPQVEEALTELVISQEQKVAKRLDWVWVPFNQDSDAPIAVIVGRIAWALAGEPDQYLSDREPTIWVDPRLALALCCVQTLELRAGSFPEDEEESGQDDSLSLGSALNVISGPTGFDDGFVERTLSKLRDASPLWLLLFLALPRICQAKLLERRLQYRLAFSPSKSDWINILRPLEYNFSKSLEGINLRVGLGLFGFSALMLSSVPIVRLARDGGCLILLLTLADLLSVAILSSVSLRSLSPGVVYQVLCHAWVLGMPQVLGVLASRGLPQEERWLIVGALVPVFVFQKIAEGFEVDKVVGRLWVSGFFGLVAALIMTTKVGDLWGLLFGALVNTGILITVDLFWDERGYPGFFAWVFFGTLLGGWSIVLFIPVAWTLQVWGALAATVFWGIFILALMGLSYRGLILERRANNPLHGLLDPILTPTTEGSSRPRE